MTIDIPEGYESLGLALGEAVAQAARGKGADRHAEKGEPFSDQLIMSIPKRLGEGGECFCLGQAAKKIFESRRLPPERARAELLGAVNYIAAAWCLLGGGESVFAPEAPGNVCLGFAERVVSLMKEAGVREVSFAHPGACIRADGTVTGLHFAAESVSAPEDIDEALHFEKGELLEYRSADGTWKPARFAFMDGGYFVIDAGGERFGVLGSEVRKADAAGPAAPLFYEGERVEYAVQGEWKPAAYVGVGPDGKHVVRAGSSYIHLDGSLVRKA